MIKSGIYTGSRTVKIDEILKLHLEGNPICEIVKKIKERYNGTTYSSVSLVLNRRGIRANKQKMPRRTAINENYFNSISSERVAYFFGLLCADGCVSKNTKQVRLSLKSEDGYLIEEFKKEVKYSGKTLKYHPKNGSEQTYLQIYSEQWVSDLIRLGCDERKSLTMMMPQIPYEYFWDFMRGYFDGDGWITVGESKKRSYKRFGIIGSISFVLSFRCILNSYYINSCLSIGKGHKYAELIVSKQKSVLKIRDLMYQNSTVCMLRKIKIFYADINIGEVYMKNMPQINWSLNNKDN